MNPNETNSKATNFQIKFPFGKTNGENAIPTAAKNATTQEVQPNVNKPNINVRNGIALEPFGSIFVRL